MCGDTNRSTFGGTIALLSPQESRISSNPSSLSSSPDSIVSASSTSTLSSYSLFFRDAETKDRNTKAIFQIDDEETFETLRGCGTVSMRIEKYGDLTTSTPNTPALHQFQLDLSKNQSLKPGHLLTHLEFELPERLDLGVSEKGVVGRQVTMREASGAVLGVGIVGYN